MTVEIEMLRKLISGAEAATPELFANVQQLHSNHEFQIEIGGYGYLGSTDYMREQRESAYRDAAYIENTCPKELLPYLKELLAFKEEDEERRQESLRQKQEDLDEYNKERLAEMNMGLIRTF